MAIITLTTDFGLDDWFVGTMKGVIATINPRATIIDITHAIPSGDIRAGAVALAASYKFFPKGTVHVAIVDPGVGSKRRAIAIQTDRHFFIGPNNGVLSHALQKERIKMVRVLADDRYFLHPVSRTFHGRDVFAPVAAHLAHGTSIARFGPQAKEFVRLNWPEPQQRGKFIEGEVIYVDKFGNAITSIAAPPLAKPGARKFEVFKGRKQLCAVGDFYQSVSVGQAVAVPGSSGYLEIAVNGGNASNVLGLRTGDRVQVRPVTSRFAAGRAGGGRTST